MIEHKSAILRLLRDDDPRTVSLVKEQLTVRGLDAVPALRDMLMIDDETVTRHVREVLGEIDSAQAAAEFTAVCPHFPVREDLESMNWLLARALAPGIDVTGAKKQLEQWGRRLRNIVSGITAADARLRLMTSFLGEQIGFRGNATDYYTVENSLLPSVVGSRLGIPISLALVYICVGERAGLKIEGVNFPGHFLARHEKVLFDPFERGRILTHRDCARILERQNLTLSDTHFIPATPRMILRRILANLLYVFQSHDETERTAQIAGWLKALETRP